MIEPNQGRQGQNGVKGQVQISSYGPFQLIVFQAFCIDGKLF